MKLVLHLIATDLRRLRVWLLLWVAVFAAMDVLGFFALQYELPPLFGGSRALSWETLTVIGGMLSLLEITCTFLVIVLLVQADRMVGTSAFWLTRPVAGPRLLIAKLITAVGVLIVLPAVVSLPWWWWCGFGLHEVAVATGQLAICAMIIGVPAAAMAALADSLSRALVWGVLVGAVAGGLELAALTARNGQSSPFHFADNAALGFFVLVAFVVAIVAQYVWRREGVSMGAAGLVFVTGFMTTGFLRPVYPRAFGLHDEQRARDVQVRWGGAEPVREGAARAFIEVTLPKSALLHVAGVMQSWRNGGRGRRFANLKLDPFANVAGPFLNASTLPASLGFAPPAAAAMSTPSTRRLILADAPQWLLDPPSAPEQHYEAVVAFALFEPQLGAECAIEDRTWHGANGRGVRILGRSENREGRALLVLTTAPEPAISPSYPSAADPECRFWCARIDRDKHTLAELPSGRQWRGMTINAVMISFREIPIGRTEGAHDTLAAITLRETARFVREVKVGGK